MVGLKVQPLDVSAQRRGIVQHDVAARRSPLAARGLRLLTTCAATVAALGGGVAGAHHGPDSMFPNPIVNWNCTDQGEAPPDPISTARFCQQDSTVMSVYISYTIPASPASHRAGIYNTLNGSYDTTDLTVSYPSLPTMGGAGETDIFYSSGSLPGNALALTWCDDASSSQCDQHYVRFETNSPSWESACHETGHAVGLTHPQQAYPVQPQGDPAFGCLASTSVYLLTHNVLMINGTY
jgi:hypothetical protein